jgi:catechol 2,3-dioxygenase-like lactoylglutathione lyase family enzyme
VNAFINTIVFVCDIAKSKRFYQNVIGLRVEREFDTVVFFENHFVIHDGNALLKTIFNSLSSVNFRKGKKNIEIYFETDNIDVSYATVRSHGCKLIHGIEKQPWGQLVFRFYDPDGHIIEIGAAAKPKDPKDKKDTGQSSM